MGRDDSPKQAFHAMHIMCKSVGFPEPSCSHGTHERGRNGVAHEVAEESAVHGAGFAYGPPSLW
jgi:hypothetical protein